MDDLISGFVEPTGAWGARDMVNRTPPDLDADYAARLISVLVEKLGGQVTVTRPDLQAVRDRAILLVREGADILELETRRLSFRRE